MYRLRVKEKRYDSYSFSSIKESNYANMSYKFIFAGL